MPDWFLIAVFFACYAMFLIVMALFVCSIIYHLTNMAWMLLRKVFPQLPEDIEDYEQILERGRRARAELVRLPDRDKHRLH